MVVLVGMMGSGVKVWVSVLWWLPDLQKTSNMVKLAKRSAAGMRYGIGKWVVGLGFTRYRKIRNE
jgi:hypothetical protein